MSIAEKLRIKKQKPSAIVCNVPHGFTERDIHDDLKKFEPKTIEIIPKRAIAVIGFGGHRAAKRALRHLEKAGLYGKNVEPRYSHIDEDKQNSIKQFLSTDRPHTYQEARTVVRYIDEIDRENRTVEPSDKPSDNSWEIVSAKYIGMRNGQPTMQYEWAPSYGPLSDAVDNGWEFFYQHNIDLPEYEMDELYKEFKKLHPDDELPESATDGYVAAMNEHPN